MPIPDRIWLPLSEATDFIRKTCECSVETAREALLGALRDGQVNARGTRPNPVYERAKANGFPQGGPDGWRRAFPPLVGRKIDPNIFLSQNPDWQSNTVGQFSDVEVNRISILQWLGEGEPVERGAEAVPEGADVGGVTAHDSTSHADAAKLRVRLKQWLEDTARTEDPEKLTKDDFLAGARGKVDNTITQNMFNEVWRSTDLPKGFKQQGRRPGRQK